MEWVTEEELFERLHRKETVYVTYENEIGSMGLLWDYDFFCPLKYIPINKDKCKIYRYDLEKEWVLFSEKDHAIATLSAEPLGKFLNGEQEAIEFEKYCRKMERKEIENDGGSYEDLVKRRKTIEIDMENSNFVSKWERKK